ncbi:MiaB/RimO family radical SAM methylthiotransferase [bacterium]|nr:MiaB/RimO family radical SAM methylthiotransferase [bacterium]
MTKPSFTYFSRVFGCQMNVADVDDLSARLAAYGGSEVSRPDEADLILINTCTVRQKAEDKAMSFIGGLKHLAVPAGRPGGRIASLLPAAAGQVATAEVETEAVSEAAAALEDLRSLAPRRKPFVVAMGCVIPKSRKHIEDTFPHVDLLVNYSDPDIVMAELLDRFPPLAGRVIEDSYPPLMEGGRCLPSFVTAIRGCNHRCSFCVVPWARGPQRDVPLGEILAQAQQYEAAGAPDITVLGQSIMAYGKASPQPHPDFTDLMEALLEQTSFRWVSFLTSLACDMNERVIERVIANPRVTPLLHLPVQSGSDKVLGEMRRQYDTAQFRRMVKLAREARPDLYLTTDLLVGFPTETEEDFQQTLDFAAEIGFDDAFMFAYSPRPGTHSVRVYPDVLPRAEKVRRLSTLIAQQRAQSAERSRRYLGQELEVIIEQRDDNGVIARTAFNKPVHLPGSAFEPGQFSRVRITGVKVSAFEGLESEGDTCSPVGTSGRQEVAGG